MQQHYFPLRTSFKFIADSLESFSPSSSIPIFPSDHFPCLHLLSGLRRCTLFAYCSLDLKEDRVLSDFIDYQAFDGVRVQVFGENLHERSEPHPPLLLRNAEIEVSHRRQLGNGSEGFMSGDDPDHAARVARRQNPRITIFAFCSEELERRKRAY